MNNLSEMSDAELVALIRSMVGETPTRRGWSYDALLMSAIRGYRDQRVSPAGRAAALKRFKVLTGQI